MLKITMNMELPDENVVAEDWFLSKRFLFGRLQTQNAKIIYFLYVGEICCHGNSFHTGDTELLQVSEYLSGKPLWFLQAMKTR